MNCLTLYLTKPPASPLRNHFPLLAMAMVSLLLAGCSQTHYRKQADQEAYDAIAERNQDPRWATADVSIEADPRSRFYDDQDPDNSPMPIDDPVSAQYMRQVDGRTGWKGWGEKGVRNDLENPLWRQQLASYETVNADGELELSMESSLRLAYLHSPLHQRNLETLYLSSLDVTSQRFRLDTQYFGGSGTNYVHRGDISPVAISYSPPLGDYVVAGPFETPQANRFSLPTDLQARRRLATAGEVLVGFANSFTWDFTGADVGIGSSLANFSFVQPLLRGAGKKVALEQLTRAERRLLSNLRAYAQFRQGFFTQVVIGDLGVSGPQRSGASTQLQSFSGFGGVGGYLGLLQQSQQIRNTRDNLRLQLRTQDRLKALYDNELIDIVQVDQFEQSIETTRASLLDQTTSLELAVDNYKTQVMGLPSDLEVVLDETLLKDFQLVPMEAIDMVDSLLGLQEELRDLGDLIDLQVSTVELGEAIAASEQWSGDDAVENTLDLLQLPVRLSAILRISKKWEGTSAERQKAIVELDALADGCRAIVARMRDEGPESAMMTAAEEKLIKDGHARCVELWEQLVGEESVADQLASKLEKSKAYFPKVKSLLALAETELQRLDSAFEERKHSMSEEEVIKYEEDKLDLKERLLDITIGENSVQSAEQALDDIAESQDSKSEMMTAIELTAWTQGFPQVVERLSLIPAKVRLEVITVTEVDLSPEEAFALALKNRLDFMNGRAALVDQWRAIEIAANQLESNLSITGDWDIGTARNNALDFRSGTSNFRLGVEFDAPLARLLERNGYRESLITFQRSRRQFIQSRDALQKGLRALLRTLGQRREQLEIQRRAVSIALRRAEQTQLSLLAPPRQLQPGARPQINPTTAFNLLQAQGSLQRSQNSFLSAWLNYYAARLRLYRELGVMELDAAGAWIENPLSSDELKTDPVDSTNQLSAASQAFEKVRNTTEQAGSATSQIKTPSEIGFKPALAEVQERILAHERILAQDRALIQEIQGRAGVEESERSWIEKLGFKRASKDASSERSEAVSERVRSAARPSVREYPVR